MSSVQSHADFIHGGDEGNFFTAVENGTTLSSVKELMVIEVFGEVSIGDIL